MLEKEKIEQNNLDKESIADLAFFFDLLAKYDHEDKTNEKLVVKTGPLVSAPMGSVLVPKK